MKTIVTFALLFSYLLGKAIAADFSKSLEKSIAKGYNIRIVKSEKARCGIENDVFIDRKNGIVIKIYNKDSNSETELLRLLENSNIRNDVQHVIKNKDNNEQSIVSSKEYVLFGYISGNHPDKLNNSIAQYIVKVLRELHTFGYDFSNKFKDRNIDDVIDHARFVLYDESNDLVFNSKVKNGFSIILEEAKESLNKYTYQTILHFDIHAKNIVVNKDGVHIIDFGDFIVGSPILELASFIRGTCFNKTNHFDNKLANFIITSYHFEEQTGEFLNVNDLYKLIQFDILRAMMANIEKQTNISKKREIFNRYYARMLSLLRYVQNR